MRSEADRIAHELTQAWYAATDQRPLRHDTARCATDRLVDAIRDAARLHRNENGAARSQLDLIVQTLDRDVLEVAFMLAVSEFARSALENREA